MQIYLDGKFYSKEEAKISVFDHGFLYGDGVFEGLRVYSGRIFRLQQHLARLYRSARGIMLEIPLDAGAMAEVVRETVRRNGLLDAYIRLVVSRGPGDLGLNPVVCPKPTVICIVDKLTLWPRELYERGIRVATAATRRNSPDALDPSIKSLNYLNNVLARLEANRQGMGEVLMLNAQGYVCEGSADNVFLVVGGELWTPPVAAGALEGITRNAVMELAAAEGIVAREMFFNRQQVYTADECFLTGTGAEIVPVVEADGRRIADGAPGPITKRLTEAFHRLTRTEGEPVLVEEPRAAKTGS
ncbi:branched-chain-amino-acid transaminase [bacterium]|nr:branched-chain-amino-acid transaminase [bacterium]